MIPEILKITGKGASDSVELSEETKKKKKNWEFYVQRRERRRADATALQRNATLQTE